MCVHAPVCTCVFKERVEYIWGKYVNNQLQFRSEWKPRSRYTRCVCYSQMFPLTVRHTWRVSGRRQSMCLEEEAGGDLVGRGGGGASGKVGGWRVPCAGKLSWLCRELNAFLFAFVSQELKVSKEMTLMATHNAKLTHVHVSPEWVGFHLYQKEASHWSTVSFVVGSFPFSLDLGKITFWPWFETLILCAFNPHFLK